MEKLQQEKEREEYDQLLKKTQEELHDALGAVPKGLTLLGFEALDMIRKLFSNKSGAAELLKVRMEIAKQANLEAEEKIKKAKEEMKATDRDFMEAVVQLSQLDLNKVSYEDAVRILKQAVEFISNLLTHWRQLQEFCKSLNSAIQLQLTDGSKKLEQDFQYQLSLSQNDRSLMTEDILGLLKSISQQSYQIGCIGELYVKISSVYIMPAIGALSENSAVDSGRIEEVRKELTANATKAHESIVVTIESEKETLLSKVKAEKLKIDELLAITDDNNDDFMV